MSVVFEYSTNKTYRDEMPKILLKVALDRYLTDIFGILLQI
jgi:hypothetical protein